MPRKSRLALLLAGTAIAMTTGAFLSRTLRLDKVYAKSTPVALTAEYVVKSLDVNNVERHSARELYARRSDGSHVLLRRTVNDRDIGLSVITDVSKKMTITVDPRTRSISSYSLSDDERAALSAPPAACEEGPEMQLDTQSQKKMLEFEVVHFAGKTRDGDHPVERWMAPSLNCLVIRSEISTAGFRNTRTAAFVTLGEPDPNLFVVPDGYVERSPSEVFGVAKEKQLIPHVNPKTASELDSVYQSRKVKR